MPPIHSDMRNRAASSPTVRSRIRRRRPDVPFLGFLEQEAEGSSLEPYEDHLYRFAGARSAVLGKLADEIEVQLGAWHAVAVSGLVSGPFAIYNSPHGRGLPSSTCPPRPRSSTWT
jgi:hypothetical protein